MYYWYYQNKIQNGWLVVGWLPSSWKYFMYIQYENMLNNICYTDMMVLPCLSRFYYIVELPLSFSVVLLDRISITQSAFLFNVCENLTDYSTILEWLRDSIQVNAYFAYLLILVDIDEIIPEIQASTNLDTRYQIFVFVSCLKFLLFLHSYSILSLSVHLSHEIFN
jgi:hypothetical protein